MAGDPWMTITLHVNQNKVGMPAHLTALIAHRHKKDERYAGILTSIGTLTLTAAIRALFINEKDVVRK